MLILLNLEANYNYLVHILQPKQVHYHFMDVIHFLTDLSAAQKDFFSELIILANFILVMPATNASSERSFSA